LSVIVVPPQAWLFSSTELTRCPGAVGNTNWSRCLNHFQ